MEHRQFRGRLSAALPQGRERRSPPAGASAAQAACQISRRQTRRLVGHHHTDRRVHHSGTLFRAPSRSRVSTAWNAIPVPQLLRTPELPRIQPPADRSPATMHALQCQDSPAEDAVWGIDFPSQANSFPEEQTIKAIACPALRRRKTLDNRSHSSPLRNEAQPRFLARNNRHVAPGHDLPSAAPGHDLPSAAPGHDFRRQRPTQQWAMISCQQHPCQQHPCQQHPTRNNGHDP